MKIKKYLFLYLFTLTIFADEDQCMGFVSGIDYSGDTFYGMCSDSGSPNWGEWHYANKDIFVGFFKDGMRWRGTYNWNGGDYMSGEKFFKTKSKNDHNYDFFGRYTFEETGNSHIGYMLGSNLNGFGVLIWEKDPSQLDRQSEAGIFKSDDSGIFLNGYGVRTSNEIKYIGYWEKGAISNGDYYVIINDGDVTKYKQRNGVANGPFDMNRSDYSRYQNIMDFVDDGIDDLTSQMEEVDSYIEEYNFVKSEFTEASENQYTEPSDSKSIKSDIGIVTSTQELLIELGYSIGEVDGLLGEKTIAAIKAFEYELDLDELTGLPSEMLLIALQLAIKSEKSKDLQSTDKDPILVGTGTGFYINDTNVISNHHVIENCVYQTDSKDQRLNLLVADVVNDLALLEGPKNDSSLNISPDAPALGERIYVSGYPYNSDLKSFMITSGNVSSLTGLGKNFSEFSHTAPSQPGNSGGPIVNEYGSLVGVLVGGINSSNALSVDLETGVVDGSLPQNINFGIKNTVLKSLLSDNNIITSERNTYFTKSQKNIAELSKKASVLIKCYGYYD